MCDYESEVLVEGCGKEGPLRGIFLAEFHPDQGPIIRCQVPGKLVCKEAFDSLNVFIIPKRQLASHTITVNSLGFKILGYPIVIADKKYRRNQFMFNVCFVCYPGSKSAQFESASRTLADYFSNLEQELCFFSNEGNNQRIITLLGQILSDLNTKGETVLKIEGFSTHLKIIPKQFPHPPQIREHDVPVLIQFDLEQDKDHIDLTSNQILPFIDGLSHVSAIAANAEVDVNLVKSCVQNLAFYNVVKIIPIFMYSNTYCVTPRITLLRTEGELKQEFMQVASRDFQLNVTFRQAYRFVTSLENGVKVRDVCIRMQVGKTLMLDEVKLIQFLTLKGIIRRIHSYPYIPSYQKGLASPIPEELMQLFTGSRTLDEICCTTGLSVAQLEKILEEDKNVRVICK